MGGRGLGSQALPARRVDHLAPAEQLALAAIRVYQPRLAGVIGLDEDLGVVRREGVGAKGLCPDRLRCTSATATASAPSLSTDATQTWWLMLSPVSSQ